MNFMKTNYCVLIFIFCLFTAAVCQAPEESKSTSGSGQTSTSGGSPAPITGSGPDSVTGSENVSPTNSQAQPNAKPPEYAKSDDDVKTYNPGLASRIKVDFEGGTDPEKADLAISLKETATSLIIAKFAKEVDDKDKTIKMKLTFNASMDECDNAGAVGDSVNFMSSGCGFTYAWDIEKNKFFITMNSGQASKSGEYMFKGDPNSAASTRDIIAEFHKHPMKQTFKNGDTEVFSSDFDCFPDFPTKKDSNSSYMSKLPFGINIGTGMTKCGISIIFEKGYVLVMDLQAVSTPMLITTTQIPTTTSEAIAKTPTAITSQPTTAESTTTKSEQGEWGGLKIWIWLAIMCGVLLIIIAVLAAANVILFKRRGNEHAE